MSESNREVLSMQSGFVQEGEKYFVPRTHVPIPFEENDVYVTHVFPNYLTWVREFQSPQGDKDKKSATSFLYKILPNLARVLIQDAPYHLKKYPNSAFSKFFRAHMCCKYPEYAEFCGEAISKAGAIAEARNTQETRDLNPATQ